jgi:aminoglycoside phosphotransferase (APT) family kinase protein
MTQDEQIELIGKFMPNFQVRTHRVLNSGINSVAILVNESHIFRFPIRQGVMEGYRREKRILDTVRPYIRSTSIPNMRICEKDSAAFTWHEVVEGTDYLSFGKLNDSTFKRNLAQGLAKFCQELHSIDIGLLDFVELRQFSTSECYRFNGESRQVLRDLLGDDYQDDLEEMIDYVNDYKNFDPSDNVLCHNDLHEENFIVNNRGLSGVIDFGEVIGRKRDFEFAHLLDYDQQLAQMTIDEYERLTGKKIDREYISKAQKTKCYGLLIWFFENGDKKYTELFRSFVINLNGLRF